jgi:hypothetical protein
MERQLSGDKMAEYSWYLEIKDPDNKLELKLNEQL